ncbi:TlpA disulfide reductase family protein [uncultured Maribacter sp.]|uniref:TlpA family protein disulfide reductase n=1 Tax=uncultured Maribacter sp. TaxID=431308 RepID=UPI00262C6A43|nr:TlpA disulfide reductase family protein [uncultured Maribacter sp.]
MKKGIVTVIFFMVSMFCMIAQDKTFAVEAKADHLMDLEGKPITFGKVLETHKGQVILLDIWASWCKDCIVGMPTLNAIKKDYPEVVYVSLDKTKDSWEKGIQRFKINNGSHYWAPKGWKSDLFTAIDLDWIPRYMVINKEGYITLYKAINVEDKEIIKQLTK